MRSWSLAVLYLCSLPSVAVNWIVIDRPLFADTAPTAIVSLVVLPALVKRTPPAITRIIARPVKPTLKYFNLLMCRPGLAAVLGVAGAGVNNGRFSSVGATGAGFCAKTGVAGAGCAAAFTRFGRLAAGREGAKSMNCGVDGIGAGRGGAATTGATGVGAAGAGAATG